MSEIRLTDEQMEDLAARIAARVAASPAVCKVFTQDQIVWLTALFGAAQKTKSVALATVVGFVVLTLMALIGAGLIARCREFLGR